MDKYGFLRVATAIPHVSVANCTKNYEEIQKLMPMHRVARLFCFPNYQ